MSAFMVLRCDDGDCTHLFTCETNTSWVLRSHARDAGWDIDAHTDLCPIHDAREHEDDGEQPAG